MSKIEDLAVTNDEGTGIKFDRLATILAGIFATAWGSSVASLVDGVMTTFVIDPLNGIANFVDRLTETITSGIEAIGTGVWDPLTALIESLGPLAWLAAVVVIIVTAYLVRKGWSLR